MVAVYIPGLLSDKISDIVFHLFPILSNNLCDIECVNFHETNFLL